MANNPVVNTLTFTGNVAGQATIQAQGIAGGLTFLLPNTVPIQGQLLDVQAINGNNVFLGWASQQSLSNIPLSALAQSGATTGEFISWNGSAWVPSSFVPGSGTVTSVALTAPAEFTVGGSPITGSGTLAITKATQSANTVWAGPTTGSAAAPTFRALVVADIPSLPYLSNTTVVPNNRPAASHNFLTAYDNTTGNFSIAQPSAADLSDSATSVGNVLRANGTSFVSATLGVGDVSGAAPLASPTFTGTVTLPPTVNATSTLSITANTGNISIINTGGIHITPAAGTEIQLGNVALESALHDGTDATGTAGQVLSSTGGGTPTTLWVSDIAGNAASITGSITESQVTGLTSDLAAKAPLASPTFTGTVVLPSAVNATGGSDLIFTATSTNKVRIATATGVFDFFGTGGGMTLATANSQVAIDASGNISLSATGGSNLSVNSAGGLVTSSDFKPTNLFSFPGNTSGTAGQLFSSLGTDSGTAWIDQSSLTISESQVTGLTADLSARATMWTAGGGSAAAGDTHTVGGTATLTTGSSGTITLSGSAVFTSAATYAVMVSYDGAPTNPGNLSVTYTDGANFVINSTSGTDGSSIRWVAIGF